MSIPSDDDKCPGMVRCSGGGFCDEDQIGCRAVYELQRTKAQNDL